MNLSEKINMEKERMKEELAALENENIEATEELKELEDAYKEALLKGDESKVNDIDSRTTETNIQIARRKIKINVLSSDDNPVIQNMILEQVKAYQETLKEIDADTSKMVSELKLKRDDYLKGIAKARVLYNKSKSYRSSIDAWNKRMNEVTREKAGLKRRGIEPIPSVAKDMNELKVNHEQVFGKMR